MTVTIFIFHRRAVLNNYIYFTVDTLLFTEVVIHRYKKEVLKLDVMILINSD